jgi:hypothetical protein
MSVHSRQDIPFFDLAGAAGGGDVLMRFGLRRTDIRSSMRLRLWRYKIWIILDSSQTSRHFRFMP